MRFTVLDLRKALGTDEGRRVGNLLASNVSFPHKSTIRYVPFIHRTGVASEQRKDLNSYDIDEILDMYHYKVSSRKHTHVKKRMQAQLNVFLKVKIYLDAHGTV